MEKMTRFLYFLLFISITGVAGVSGQPLTPPPAGASGASGAGVASVAAPAKPGDENYYKVFKPFMNSEKNLSTIIKALDIYEKKISGGGKIIAERTAVSKEPSEDELLSGEDEGEEIGNLGDDFGNVYLQSILFVSKDYWTVWVNNTKISNQTNSEEGENDFFVKEASKDRVMLVRKFSRAEWRRVNAGGSIGKNNYETDKKTNKIKLTLVLHPNQTFVALENKIIDGKHKKEVLEVDSSIVNNVEMLMDNGEINIDELLNNL